METKNSLARKKKVRNVWLISLLFGFMAGVSFFLCHDWTWLTFAQSVMTMIFCTFILGMCIFIFITDRKGEIIIKQ